VNEIAGYDRSIGVGGPNPDAAGIIAGAMMDMIPGQAVALRHFAGRRFGFLEVVTSKQILPHHHRVAGDVVKLIVLNLIVMTAFPQGDTGSAEMLEQAILDAARFGKSPFQAAGIRPTRGIPNRHSRRSGRMFPPALRCSPARERPFDMRKGQALEVEVPHWRAPVPSTRNSEDRRGATTSRLFNASPGSGL